MLELKNVHKKFKHAPNAVLNDFNLCLKQGDFCVLLGTNGCGKSTLMKIISKDLAACSGELLLNGAQYSAKAIAYVEQQVERGTVAELTLLENMVLSYMRFHQTNFLFYKRFNKICQAQLDTFPLKLNIALDLPMKYLSGGQRQIIATIMALHAQTPLILLDEHTSALDAKMQQVLMQYTADKIYKNQQTTLMITHKLEDAMRYGNRLIILHEGELLHDFNQEQKQSLSIRDLQHFYTTRRIYD